MGGGEEGLGGRALLRPHVCLSLALSLFIFLVDAKVHSHLSSMFCVAIGRFVQRLFVVFVCDPAGGHFLQIDGLSFLPLTRKKKMFANRRLVVFAVDPKKK